LDAAKTLIEHPMLGGADSLAKSEAAGVFVLGGPSLAMAEVNRLMEQFHRRCDSTPVLMGAAINPEFGESLVLALLMAPAEQGNGASDSANSESAECDRRSTADPLGAQLLGTDSGR